MSKAKTKKYKCIGWAVRSKSYNSTWPVQPTKRAAIEAFDRNSWEGAYSFSEWRKSKYNKDEFVCEKIYVEVKS